MIQLDRIALSVRHAAHADKTRYAMNGVLVEQKGTVATDGRILAHVTHVIDPGPTGCHVLSEETVKGTLKAMLSKGHAVLNVLNELLTAYIPGTPAVEAKGRRKAKPTVADKIIKVPLVTVSGVFPPWEDILKTDDHLEPIETTIDALETIGQVLGDHAVARLTYDETGIIAAEARPIDDNGNRYIATVRFDRLPAKDDTENLAGFKPDYFATMARIVREFHKGEDWAGAITLTLPNGRRRPSKWDKGTEARAALFVHAKRADGRRLTVLLMPVRLGA